MTKQTSKVIKQRALDLSGASFFEASDIPPLLQRVYQSRGVTSQKQLSKDLASLEAPETMLGIVEATELLVNAIKNNQRLLIVGDFDADGATSVSLCLLALRAMGMQYVDFLVPNRFEFGYGLSPEIVDLAIKKSPDIIMTVDNGISSIAGVRAAQDAGIKVIITDHHLPGETIPPADALLNPNQKGCSFKSKALAGVGVAFYLMIALRKRLQEVGWFAEQSIRVPNLADYLDLVALGTVADVVPLDSNNRILVYQGLQRIRAGYCRPGITAMLEIAKRSPETIVASDLGFAIGPRLNAAGRLDDMTVGINCLLEESLSQARIKAAELDALNIERREIEQGMKNNALAQVDNVLNVQLQKSKQKPVAFCLYQNDWHEGVVGIVASRIKELFHRPVIAFAQTAEGKVKGSARSITGLHIRDILANVDTKNPQLIDKFGGHAMAAGLSLPEKNLADFYHAFLQEVAEIASSDVFDEVILTDGQLCPEDFALDVACLLKEAGPWGQQFPEPVFSGKFEIINKRVLKEKYLKLQVKPLDSQLVVDAIYFNAEHIIDRVAEGQIVELVYKLSANEFRGNKSLQLMVDWLQF